MVEFAAGMAGARLPMAWWWCQVLVDFAAKKFCALDRVRRDNIRTVLILVSFSRVVGPSSASGTVVRTCWSDCPCYSG